MSKCTGYDLPPVPPCRPIKGYKEILHLTLNRKAFEVMVTGEKRIEYRKPTEWIKSRVIQRHYHYVKFVNGYGNDKPSFVSYFDGVTEARSNFSIEYSNGLKVDVEKGDFCIKIQSVLDMRNLKKGMI